MNPIIVIRALYLCLLLVAATAVAAQARPPNILICVSDDQSFPHASAYGCTWVSTPAFDRVAREGLLFSRAYTPNAKCAPSRAILLTGRQSWQLGAAANHGGYYPEGFPTFVETLGRHGYFTGYTGKSWAPGEPGKVDGKPRELTGPAYNRLRLATPPTRRISTVDYAGNFSEFLAARPAGQPFCFWYGGFEPHRAYDAGAAVRAGRRLTEIDRVPAGWPDNATVRSDLLDYALEIEHFDTHLGRMLAMLEAAGELENTLVIVTSDNGMPFPRAKGTTYEASLHLPLAMRWPAGIRSPGRAVSELVSFVDLAPTLLAAAGVTAEDMAPFAGRPLQPVLANESAPAPEFIVFGQERHDLGRPHDAGYPVRGVITPEWLYFENLAADRWPMGDPITGYLNTDGGATKTEILERNRRGEDHARWQLNFGKRPPVEVYHLSRDPDCLENLAETPEGREVADRLRGWLRAEQRRTGDPRLDGTAHFDDYPYASTSRGLYERMVFGGEKFNLSWVNPGDRESPDFDPEHPSAKGANPDTRPAPPAEAKD